MCVCCPKIYTVHLYIVGILVCECKYNDVVEVVSNKTDVLSWIFHVSFSVFLSVSVQQLKCLSFLSVRLI